MNRYKISLTLEVAASKFMTQIPVYQYWELLMYTDSNKPLIGYLSSCFPWVRSRFVPSRILDQRTCFNCCCHFVVSI